jgi:hypothetical protein
MEGKFIIGLMFLFSSTMSYAQKDKFISPDWEQRTHSFALPALIIDSTFIANLDTILFDKNCRIPLVYNPKRDKHFYIRFEKKDSLIYCIEVSLWDIPAGSSTGFYENNGYFYWFGGEVPPNIILETKSKKRFSYKEPIPAPYDPLFWYLMYNSEMGSIELKEKNFN